METAYHLVSLLVLWGNTLMSRKLFLLLLLCFGTGVPRVPLHVVGSLLGACPSRESCGSRNGMPSHSQWSTCTKLCCVLCSFPWSLWCSWSVPTYLFLLWNRPACDWFQHSNAVESSHIKSSYCSLLVGGLQLFFSSSSWWSLVQSAADLVLTCSKDALQSVWWWCNLSDSLPGLPGFAMCRVFVDDVWTKCCW